MHDDVQEGVAVGPCTEGDGDVVSLARTVFRQEAEIMNSGAYLKHA